MTRPIKILLGVLATTALIAASCSSDDSATNSSADDAETSSSAPDTEGTDQPAGQATDAGTGEESDSVVDATSEGAADADADAPVDVHDQVINTLDQIATPGVPVGDYFDVPAEAFGPPIDPETGYFAEEIDNGVYWVTEGSYQSMFVVTDTGVIVADAPASLASAIPAAIAQVTDLPITHMIYSHAHADHIGAASTVIDADVEIVAHEATAIELAERQDPNRPLPTVTFEETYTLNTGGRTIELSYPGTNHQEGNIFILVPDADTMMFIDVVFPGWSPWQFLALAQDIPGFIDASNELLSYQWKTLVAGHVTRLGTRADVEIQIEFVNDLQQAAGEALTNNSFEAAFGQVAANDPGDIQPWAISDAFLDAVVQDCVDTMLPKWGDRLAGLDVFLYTHCQAMEQSLRVD